MDEPEDLKPATAEYLRTVREFLARMSDEKLHEQYEEYRQYSAMRDGRPPGAWALQFLVQAWKELRRRKTKPPKN